jgi:hypothetical protein
LFYRIAKIIDSEEMMVDDDCLGFRVEMLFSGCLKVVEQLRTIVSKAFP